MYRLSFRELCFVVVFAISLSFITEQVASSDERKLILKIGTGSCNMFSNAPVWNPILKEKINYFFFLGDNVYFSEDDLASVETRLNRYRDVFSTGALAKLMPTIKTLAIWDDHDFSLNDGDSTLPEGKDSLKAFKEFWKTQATAPGFEDSVVFKEEVGPLTVFGTDDRSFRLVGKQYFGEKQLNYLATEIPKVKTGAIILMSGGQVLPPYSNWDMLGQYPVEREKLLSILRSAEVPLIILSGDSHFAELSDELWESEKIIELTASSLSSPIRSGSMVPTQASQRKTYFGGNNYGILDLYEEHGELVLYLAIRDLQGATVLGKKITIGIKKK